MNDTRDAISPRLDSAGDGSWPAALCPSRPARCRSPDTSRNGRNGNHCVQGEGESEPTEGRLYTERTALRKEDEQTEEEVRIKAAGERPCGVERERTRRRSIEGAITFGGDRRGKCDKEGIQRAGRAGALSTDCAGERAAARPFWGKEGRAARILNAREARRKGKSKEGAR